VEPFCPPSDFLARKTRKASTTVSLRVVVGGELLRGVLRLPEEVDVEAKKTGGNARYIYYREEKACWSGKLLRDFKG